ncbi:uncharacterized protein LOC128234220 [Mya arenaria]|uniref:uncharacterized protein LOC128234220 n=1 Tax=Mya arenaria TaxID=6604 RepID=UPI0022E2795A|nr:uncharacterized protein LOC128234220 [Mya arenaria]XP_052804264.1 uncharacterized protein LOC128234220 [Mya arenaria]XP_052804265.1 uncharacterized protein LOC128234220 [Mya arenaria]XP_052804266.1 uncharacterized protein LOC128234220 [Mya arenaria]
MNIVACTTFILVLLLLTASFIGGDVAIHALSETPRTSQPYTLTCSTTGTDNISWQKDGDFQSACLIQSSGCYPATTPRYDFTSGADSMSFDLTITNVSLDSCGNFICIDTTANGDSVEVTVIHFDRDILPPTEPESDSSGIISVITDCVYPNNVNIQWSTVKDGKDIGVIKDYTRNEHECSIDCAGSPAVRIQTSVFHNETKGESITVSYKLVLMHHDVDEPITWISKQIYNIEDTSRTSAVSDDKGSTLWFFVAVLGTKLI